MIVQFGKVVFEKFDFSWRLSYVNNFTKPSGQNFDQIRHEVMECVMNWWILPRLREHGGRQFTLTVCNIYCLEHAWLHCLIKASSRLWHREGGSWMRLMLYVEILQFTCSCSCPRIRSVASLISRPYLTFFLKELFPNPLQQAFTGHWSVKPWALSPAARPLKSRNNTWYIRLQTTMSVYEWIQS